MFQLWGSWTSLGEEIKILAPVSSADFFFNLNTVLSNSFIQGFPTKKSFIDMVIPQLNLNFENPEFNGIVKLNGATSESVSF